MAMRKRKSTGISQSGGSAQASEASRDSGVSQPADNEGSRILLVDAGWIRPQIVKDLVRDQRNPVEVDDIIETTEQFNAGCIVGTDFPASWKPPESSPMHTRSLCNKETSWHVWYDSDIWTLSGFELQDLGAGRSRNAHMSLRNRQCAILSLRYLDGTQMRVMVMKNLKGTAAAVDTLQFDFVKRQEIMEIVFEFLYRPSTGATMVVGDLGVGLASLHNHMRVQDVDDSVQTHCNKSQTFHALFRALNNAMTSTIDTGSQRMMLHQTSKHCSRGLHPAAEVEAPKTEPTSSRDLHPTAEAGASAKPLKIKTWAPCQVEALAKITQVSADTLTDSDDAHLTVQLLYQPFITKRQAADGCWHNDPIDVQQSAHTFTNALALLKKVRRDAGCALDGVTLSRFQFDHAYGQLKEIFAEKFMKSTKIRATAPETLDRQGTKKHKGDVRGAFKVWARELLGHHAFLLAVLRHGLFEFSDLKQYAELLASERSKDDGGTEPGGVKQPARKQALRQQALRARRALREAKKFRTWRENGWQLRPWQDFQVMQLELGKLEEQMKEANASYGHGVGADTGLTKEQAMTLEIFTERPLRK